MILFYIYCIKNIVFITFHKSFYNIKKPREVINKKMKLAFIKKYGVENPSCCCEVKEKKKKTFIKHYGTNHYFQTSEFKQKAKESKINKYGDPNFSNRDLAKHTLNRKYGVDNVSQLQIVKDKKRNKSRHPHDELP